MVARGTSFRLRQLQREMRLRSFSLTDLVELPSSGEEEENEDDLFGLLDSALEQRRESQGANSSEGDRSSEVADSVRTRSSTTALERAGRGRRCRPKRRFRSLIDLSRTSITTEQIPCLLALRGAGDLLFETTKAILRTHRKRSRQAILHELLEAQEPRSSKDRKSSVLLLRGAGDSTVHFGWRPRAESPFIVPDDVVSLIREIEERYQNIARECRERARLLDEYRDQQQRYQCEQLQEFGGQQSFATSFSSAASSSTQVSINVERNEGDLRQQFRRSIRAHEELIASIALFLAKREQQPSIVDGGVELSSSQVLGIILALNSQLGNLLVCHYVKYTVL